MSDKALKAQALEDDIRYRMARLRKRSMVAVEKNERAMRKKAAERQRASFGARSIPLMTAGSSGVSTGGYGNAGRNRLRDGGVVRGGSAQSHLRKFTADSLRRDSQDLDRNNCLAQALVGGSADLVVGYGPKLEILSDDIEWNKAAEEWFRNWWLRKENFDHAGLRSGPEQVYEWYRGGMLVDGDVGAIKTREGRTQTIEAERIQNPSGAFDDEFNRGGIRLDSSGRVSGYNVSDWYPGIESFAMSEARLIPAESFLFLANPLRYRSGQYRGEPALASVVDRLEHLDQLDESVRTAYYVAACHAALVTSETPAIDQGLAYGESLARNDGSGITDRMEDIEPGTIRYLGMGKTVTQVSPTHPSANYESLVYNEIVKIAASFRLPVVILLLDFAKINFGSQRAALATCWTYVNRARMAIENNAISPLVRWRLALAMRRGEIPGYAAGFVPAGAWDKHEWIWPSQPVLNLMEEAQAAELAINSGLKTRKQVYSEQFGQDYDAVIDRIAFEQQDLLKRGIEFMRGKSGGEKETKATERAGGEELEGTGTKS